MVPPVEHVNGGLASARTPLLGDGGSGLEDDVNIANVNQQSSAPEGIVPELPKREMNGKSHALFGAASAPFESLDYEIVESEVYKEDWRSRTPVERLQYIFLKWIFVLIIGISVGLVAFGINWAVENVAGLKFSAVLYFMSDDRYILACAVYAALNVVLVWSSSTLCAYLAPAAGGSGIPEVKAYLNGIDAPDILSPKTLIVKILGSIGSVGGGLAVGKEGPLVHTGACIAAILGQGGSKKYNLTAKWLRFFKNDRDRRDLVTCGAAAGVAAAFRAPVGGVLFALEEATSWWRSPLLWRAFFTNAVVAVTLRTVMAYCKGGRCGLYSDSGFIIFDKSEVQSNYGLLELVPVIVLGITGGILGGLFNQLNITINRYRRDLGTKRTRAVKVAEAMLIAVISSVLQFSIPFLAPCLPCPDPVLHVTAICPTFGRAGNYKNFNCPPNHYNDLAGLLFNTNDDSIRNLFSTGTFHAFSYISLAVFLVTFYSLALVTYGIAVPSGLFVPAILCGSAYGRMVGMVMASIAGSARVDEGTYALLGAASFLGGSMRMTVSLCIILVELTGNLSTLPLIMLVLLIAKTVGDALNGAIYDLHVALKRIPFLEARPEQFMKRLLARDALPPDNQVVSLRVQETVGNILQALQTSHNGFPVIEESSESRGPVLYGLVLRAHLLVLLKLRHEICTPAGAPPQGSSLADLSDHIQTAAADGHHEVGEISIGEGHSSQYSSVDFGKPGTGKGLRLEDVQVDPAEMDMLMDLRPFANTSPYCVAEDMSLYKAYMVFRELGLRHLLVTPHSHKDFPVMGVITRKDLLPDRLLERFPEEHPELKILERSFSSLPTDS